MWEATVSYSIKSLYDNSQACVRGENRISQWFNIRQGCVLFPPPFNLYMDRVMREAEASWKEGVQMRTTQAEGLLFADDVAITAEEEKDPQHNSEILDQSLKKRSLKMHVTKTKIT